MAFNLKCFVLTGAVLALQTLANDSSLRASPSTISEHTPHAKRSSTAQPIMDEAALQEAVQIKEASRPTEHSAGLKALYLQAVAEPNSQKKVQALEAALEEPENEDEVPAKKNLRASTKVAAKEEKAADAPSLENMLDPSAWKTNSSSGESAMEKQLTDLMMAGGNIGATPFGKSVSEITRVIKEEMMDQVEKAHKANQEQLYMEVAGIKDCRTTKNTSVGSADEKRDVYVKTSGLHKTCRSTEAGKYTEMTENHKEMGDKKKIMDLKCHEFEMVKKQYGNQQANGEIVKKQGSEKAESYIKRLTSTICGKYPPGGLGGGGKGGFLDLFMIAKHGCETAQKDYKKQKKAYETILEEYTDLKASCDSLQDQMDSSSCKRATEMKDACEAYAECYFDRKKVHLDTVKMVKTEETDRKAEWRGLNRMKCLMEAFKDGKVKNSEIKKCKNEVHDTSKFTIDYPSFHNLDVCAVPNLYPSTPAYKLAEFAPLPAYAKGREDANECTGVIEINETPAKNSPKGCHCERLTLNGPYSAGPLVKCTNCKPARRSQEANSCPEGTKLFSPRSESDWKTIIHSVGPIGDPFTIVDVTTPKGGNELRQMFRKKAMNSASPATKMWHTSDGSPWWLRSTVYKEANRDGQPNCYLGVKLNGNSFQEFAGWPKRLGLLGPNEGCKGDANAFKASVPEGMGYYIDFKAGVCKKIYLMNFEAIKEAFANGKTDDNGSGKTYLPVDQVIDEKNITFSYDGCQHHAKSYICQLKEQDFTPKKGSPDACKCKPVVLTGPYSAGSLMKCTNCLDVHKSKQKNSCPMGTKIFSPANSGDWKTFLASAKPLRSPHWIIDVTRPQNGCGGCMKKSMNSKEPAQMTWITADGSPWWLRNSRYSEPSGDYKANCYMDLWQTPFSETSITFNDGNCDYHADSYYCQPAKPVKEGASLLEANETHQRPLFWRASHEVL